MTKNCRRTLGFVVVALGAAPAACSVDTSDVHFLPDDVLAKADANANDAGGAPDAGGVANRGGVANVAGVVGKGGTTAKAGAGTGGSRPTAGAPTGGAPAGGSGSTGGRGGAGGNPAQCPTAAGDRKKLLIDDFDDGDSGLPDPPQAGRMGGWYVVSDLTPGAVQVPPNDPSRPPIPDMPGVGGVGFALHTQGTGFTTWGAGFGVTLLNGSTNMACPYDASVYTGVRVSLQGNIVGTDPLLQFHFVTTDVADMEHGGTCDAKTEKCYDNFTAYIDVPSTWKSIDIPFTALKQAGWGASKKLYPSHVVNLEFISAADADFDFWIDQVEFY